jgi:hypothetical protein
MNSKRLKKDNKGIAGVVIALIVVVILIGVAFAAYVVVGYDPDDGDDHNAPPIDPDEEDPIIGYLDISAILHFENPNWGDGASKRNIEDDSVTCTMTNISAPGMSFLDKLMKMLSVDDDDFVVSYEVRCPTLYGDDVIFSGDSKFNMRIAEGDTEHHTVHFTTAGIRYHAPYVIAIEFYWSDGGLIDSMTKTFNV